MGSLAAGGWPISALISGQLGAAAEADHTRVPKEQRWPWRGGGVGGGGGGSGRSFSSSSTGCCHHEDVGNGGGGGGDDEDDGDHFQNHLL